MGKSGSFFFFSHDDRFLIKTMTMGDFNAFMKLFRFYFEHMCTSPKSLLARIYGVYSVQMDEQDPVYLILMGNSTKCDSDYVLSKFDLKGSLVKRLVPPKKGKPFKNTDILKDKNILALKKKMTFLKFGSKDRKRILK